MKILSNIFVLSLQILLLSTIIMAAHPNQNQASGLWQPIPGKSKVLTMSKPIPMPIMTPKMKWRLHQSLNQSELNFINSTFPLEMDQMHPMELFDSDSDSEEPTQEDEEESLGLDLESLDLDGLLHDLSDRVADIGSVYLIRDILNTFFATDNKTKLEEGSVAAAGLVALALQQAGNLSFVPSSKQHLLIDASDIVGIGAGLVGFSLDLQAFFNGIECLAGFKSKEDCYEDDGTKTEVMGLTLDTIGALLGIVADIIGFFFTDAGSYTSVIEVIWSIAAHVFKESAEESKLSKLF